MNKLTQIPKFKTASQEKAFWQKHDSANYIDWSHAKQVSFPNLKPSTKTISLRLPENFLNDIKIQANKEDVPYQSLMKILLDFGLREFVKLGRSIKQKPKIPLVTIPVRSVLSTITRSSIKPRSKKFRD